MFSISKAFRVLSLVLVAVLVPATAFAGTSGYAAAKPGQAQTARPNKVLKLKKGNKVTKSHKAKPGKATNPGHGRPKVKIAKKR
jgi:hypothetical protein